MKPLMSRCALMGALLLAALLTPVGANAAGPQGPTLAPGTALHILTWKDPGTAGYTGRLSTADYRRALVAEQDATLEQIGADKPVYRWTTALSGVAVPLDAIQLLQARLVPGLSIERDSIRPVAGAPAAPGSAAPGSATAEQPAGTGGKGTVIGVVDTGIATDTPVFAAHRSLGQEPTGFSGTCEPAEGWGTSDCNGKVISANWFVDGFGAENLRAGAALSPRDDNGHGTQVASIAAGNRNVSALFRGEDLGTFSGTAPDARIAVYKACWAAPDPDDDGCSSADVISAVDRAVQDGVDVLNLSITGVDGFDAVDRALLGATEADVVVTTAAGNGGATTGNDQPWMTTVGATTGRDLGGELRLSDGGSITGVLTSRSLPDPARLVLAAQSPAPGHTRDEARLCTPGSLDAGRVSGRIVVCERGTVARVDKSAAVELADGVAMVLVNGPEDHLGADFHAVPTLHVSAEEGAELRSAMESTPRLTGELAPAAGALASPEVLPDSDAGAATGTVLKPDLVAHGFGVLAASSSLSGNGSWQLLTGTSAAAARVSGLAARVRAEHPDWSATRVRSALATTATPALGSPSVRRQGSGVADSDVTRPGLVLDLDAADYREVLEDSTTSLPDYNGLNLPSVQVASPERGVRVVRRTVTNVGGRNMYYSSATAGFSRHDVTVTPAALRLAPGESARIAIRIPARAGSTAKDSGVVLWRGADGTRVRIPVALTR